LEYLSVEFCCKRLQAIAEPMTAAFKWRMLETMLAARAESSFRDPRAARIEDALISGEGQRAHA
jgi:hypothetical protein